MSSLFLTGMYLSVMNLSLCNIIILIASLFANLMSINRGIFIYLSFIPGVINTLVTIDTGDDLIVVLTFRNTNSGPNIYSASMMSSLVTGKFVSYLPLIVLS